MVEKNRQCVGCGSVLQDQELDAPGYVPASAWEQPEVLCRRCFRIRNYGEFSRVAVSPEQYAQEVSRIGDQPGLVLYVLDVFDLSGSLISNLTRYVTGSRVVVVVNKTDVLPPEVSPESLESWVRQTVESTGILPVEVLFVSAERNRGMESLVRLLEVQPDPVVYAVGMANVGKSTLLNRILHHLGHHVSFTASRVPGTTLGAVGTEVTLPSGRTLRVVDTPGLIHGNRVTDKLCVDCLKAAVPADRIKPRIFQLDPGQTLWLGGFARIDFEEGPHQSLVCYVSNRLTVHRTKTERAEAIYENRVDEVLGAPCADCREALGDFIEFPVAGGRYRTNMQSARHLLPVERAGTDLVLAGLGWIALQGSDFRGRLYAPRGIEVSTRKKLVGGLTSGWNEAAGRSSRSRFRR